MKKALKVMAVAAILMFATSESLMAQFKFGVKASGMMNNMFLEMDSSSTVKRAPVFGFNVGVMGEIFVSDNISVGAELVFAQQGFKRTSSYDENDVYGTYSSESEMVFRTNHINLPVLLRFYVGGLAIELGPQVSFCFGGKVKQKFSSSYTYGGETEHHSSDTTMTFAELEKDEQQYCKEHGLSDYKLWNRINVGATLGLSYNLENGLFFGARYTYDFTNLFNDYEIKNDLARKVDMKSHYGVLQVSVGFKF